MTSRRPRHLVVRALAVAALGTGLTVAACEAPHPTGLKPTARVPLTSVRAGADAERAVVVAASDAEVRETLRTYAPAALTGTGHAQLVWLVQDASGRVVQATSGPAAASRGTTEGKVRVTLNADGSRTATMLAPALPKAPSEPFMASLDPNTIKSVEITKFAPGRVAPDSTNVIWVRLRAPGEASAEAGGTGVRMRVQRAPEQSQASAERERTVAAAGDSAARKSYRFFGARGSAETANGTRFTQGGVLVRVDGAAVRTPNDKPAPLFVVDGRELPVAPDGGTPDVPSADAIATVDVLKGDAAVAAYGERGRSGVVRIVTKAYAEQHARVQKY